MIVPQVDLGRSPVGDAPCLKVHHSHKFGFFVQLAHPASVVPPRRLTHGGWELSQHTHCHLDPNGLAARQLGHLLDVREVEHPPVGPVLGRKHVLLPGLAQQSLDGDSPRGQAVGAGALVAVRLADPAPVDEDGGAGVALERRDDHVAVLAVAHAGPDEHLLVVAEGAGRADTAVVEVVDGRGVDGRREREGVADEAVLQLGDEVRLPPEALDLPRPEGEGRDGDEGEEDDARAVAFAGADDLRRRVEDGCEAGVVGGLLVCEAAPGSRGQLAMAMAMDWPCRGAACREGRGLAEPWGHAARAKASQETARAVHVVRCGLDGVDVTEWRVEGTMDELSAAADVVVFELGPTSMAGDGSDRLTALSRSQFAVYI